jgi:excisionase family DNA binding protein
VTCAVLELDHPDALTQQASSHLERAMNSARNVPAVLVVDGEQIEIPEAVLRVLLHAAHEQAVGHRIRVLSPDSDDELTPNQAAAYLGISRPLLVKLLNDGTIPARTLPGSRHRRIAVADLEAYHTLKSRRRRRLTAAMQDVAETDLYLPRD